jgi:hypothetical protein
LPAVFLFLRRKPAGDFRHERDDTDLVRIAVWALDLDLRAVFRVLGGHLGEKRQPLARDLREIDITPAPFVGRAEEIIEVERSDRVELLLEFDEAPARVDTGEFRCVLGEFREPSLNRFLVGQLAGVVANRWILRIVAAVDRFEICGSKGLRALFAAPNAFVSRLAETLVIEISQSTHQTESD